jgi:hypothetical protein
VKILKVDTKRSRISLQTSLKRYTSLHRESLIKLSGASVSPEQLHGRLRLSLLLATIGRREEASEIMSQCTQDPAFPLFQLRMFIWNMAEIRKLLAGISKKPTAVWLTAIKKMHKLQVQYAGSPYLEVTVKQRHQWAGKARNHLPARTLLKRAVSLKRRSPKQALELCEILVTFYGRTRQAQEAAKMIKSLPR